ncbi:MAG: hypothetical protein HYZ09_03795 [Candidatus Kerfeldbacteria bacterium]|nr:hypothetical protein [Candidatus Kerfeldbacteria bacterium]
MVGEPKSTTKIGDWPLSRFGRLANVLAFTAGIIGVVLVAFRTHGIYLWTVLLVFYIVLSFRLTRHGGRGIHLLTTSWLTGVPLGFAFGVTELLTYRDSLYVLDLVRLPILVSLFGIVVTTATGYARTRRVTTRHLLFGDHEAPRRGK